MYHKRRTSCCRELKENSEDKGGKMKVRHTCAVATALALVTSIASLRWAEREVEGYCKARLTFASLFRFGPFMKRLDSCLSRSECMMGERRARSKGRSPAEHPAA